MENNQEIIENAELNMMAAIGHLETELAKIRAGKANPVMLKGISVEYYGNLTPLNSSLFLILLMFFITPVLSNNE